MIQATIVLDKPLSWQYIENEELKARKAAGPFFFYPYAVHDQIIAEFPYSDRLNAALTAMSFIPEDYTHPLLTQMDKTRVSIRKVEKVENRLRVTMDVMDVQD